MKIIVVKVGTQAILAADGTMLLPVVANLVAQISKLQDAHTKFVLVSSGAVGSGRKIARELIQHEYGTAMVEKQLLASIGQPELMRIYSALFKKHRFTVSQLLLTKQDFHTRQHYFNIGRLLREIMQQPNIIPIINENDSVAIEELMFTDNDELAGLLAAQLGATKLILLTSVSGVYDGDPADPNSKIIPVIHPTDKLQVALASKSLLGRGGMQSKLAIARKMSHLGITTHIAQATAREVLPKIMQNEAVGTTVLPLKKKSSAKRWMAFAFSQNPGRIYINSCLYQLILAGKQALSILPVGIDKFSGDFKKGDLIDIISPQNKKIGLGVAGYGAEQLQQYCGKKQMPAFIHYDRLFIDIPHTS